MQIALGRMVHYTLTASDVETILQGRIVRLGGGPAHNGSTPHPGDILPMIVTAISVGTKISGKVMLNGTDTLWVQDVHHQREKRGCWSWTQEVKRGGMEI